MTLETIENHRAAIKEFIRRSEDVPGERWDRPRASGKWAPAQEVAHLVLTYRSYIIELLEGPVVTPDTYPARHVVLRARVLPRILKGNWFPSGGVSPEVTQPGTVSREKTALLKELSESVNGFESAAMEEAERNPGRYVRHPHFGALNLVDLIKVLTEHTKHHTKNLPGSTG